MYRKDFCEINQLKKMIASGMEWPHVIINTKTKQEQRADIKGTLSLFSSNKGEGYYTTGNSTLKVNEDTFIISNEEQHYGIDIHSPQVTETFNIHFSTKMLRHLYPVLTLKEEELLDQVDIEKGEVNFYNKLYWKDEVFRGTVKSIQYYQSIGELDDIMTEQLLSDLLSHLYQKQISTQKNINTASVVKKSTKEEILARLANATDYIHSHYQERILLDQLAIVACLSKYHFLRLFKQVYRMTPYQYISNIRLDKASQLLGTTHMNIGSIALQVGYDNISTFSRAFKRRYKTWPQIYRAMV